MLTFTLGTFAIALNHLLLISALALATFVGWRVAKRGGDNPESALFSLFLLGMLAARGLTRPSYGTGVPPPTSTAPVSASSTVGTEALSTPSSLRMPTASTSRNSSARPAPS